MFKTEYLKGCQTAFQDLTQYIIDELEARDDGEIRGIMNKMKKELLVVGFGRKGLLPKSYLGISFFLAGVIHHGKVSPAIRHIWNNFLATGEGLRDSVTNGPLYTPNRLMAAWYTLKLHENTPFRVDTGGIVAVTSDGPRAWHTLSIANLQKLNRL